MALIKIKGLNFTYPLQRHNALSNIDLDIEDGEFFLLCGASGSGKSTLLRQLKRELTPFGKKSGRISYNGRPLDELSDRESVSEIGFVMQDPENQLVTDKVWHELAFGLESLGLPTKTIRRRVAETASFFGIQSWFLKNVSELSGGQKQILNLASVMVMQPRVLILDEPTSQLDPIAAAGFLETVRRINLTFSLTVILSEHRLEEVFSAADRVGVMENGKIICCGSPRETAAKFSPEGTRHKMFAGFPAAVRIFSGVGGAGDCPITVRDGSRWLSKHFSPCKTANVSGPQVLKHAPVPYAELNDVFFKYGKEMPDVLRGVTLKLQKGQIACLLGGNGTGKSTLLSVIAGLYKAYRGTVRIMGRKMSDYRHGELYNGMVSVLPQDPKVLFVHDTVRKDLEEMASECNTQNILAETVREMGIESLLERHPYDLSGGEQQKAAFAKLLLRSPKIILLDEPTKGLDADFKISFAAILKRAAKNGAAILIATHDVEFAAEYSDYCLLFFNGSVISEDTPVRFFSGNSFYTTAANRIARGTFPEAVTCGEVIEQCVKSSNRCVSK